MVTSDHLIFGINSNVLVNGGDNEMKTSEREIQAWRNKFQILFALLSQARKSILVILIWFLSLPSLSLGSTASYVHTVLESSQATERTEWKAHVEHFKIIYANLHNSPPWRDGRENEWAHRAHIFLTQSD